MAVNVKELQVGDILEFIVIKTPKLVFIYQITEIFPLYITVIELSSTNSLLPSPDGVGHLAYTIVEDNTRWHISKLSPKAYELFYT